MNAKNYKSDQDIPEVYTCYLEDDHQTDRRDGDILTCVKQPRRQKKANIINLFA